MKKLLLIVLMANFAAIAVEKDEERIKEQTKEQSRFPGCRVMFYSPKWYSGSECRYMDEAMVGYDAVGGRIQCARLSVECDRTAKERTEDEIK